MSIEALKEYIRLFDAQEDNTAQQFKLLNEQIAIMEEKDDLQTALTICVGRLITMKIISGQSQKKN